MKSYPSVFFFAALSVFSLAIDTAVAHPHHENDLLGSLGIDHMLYALGVIAITFILFGKFSK